MTRPRASRPALHLLHTHALAAALPCPHKPQVATYALIWPAKRRPDVVVAAVAARDGKRAAAYAQKHG